MNDFLAGLTESAFAGRVGWVLIHFLWQGADLCGRPHDAETERFSP